MIFEFVMLLLVVALVGGGGMLIGLRLGPRIERWTEEREESHDDDR